MDKSKKINFNVTTGKAFRDELTKFAIAFKCEAAIDIKACDAKWDTTIATDTEIVDKIKAGDTQGLINCPTLEEAEKTLNMHQEMYLAERGVLEKKRDAAKIVRAKGRQLITTTLFDAIVKACEGIYEDEAEAKLTEVIVGWFRENGFADACDEAVRPFVRVSYSAIKNPTLTQMVKEKSLKQRQESRVKIAETFLMAIYNEPSMHKLLAPTTEKWEHVWDKDAKRFIQA